MKYKETQSWGKSFQFQDLLYSIDAETVPKAGYTIMSLLLLYINIYMHERGYCSVICRQGLHGPQNQAGLTRPQHVIQWNSTTFTGWTRGPHIRRSMEACCCKHNSACSQTLKLNVSSATVGPTAPPQALLALWNDNHVHSSSLIHYIRRYTCYQVFEAEDCEI